MKKTIELLAPAGSPDALAAAVQKGADAVYMGGTKFNARRSADNFDEEGLLKAVRYAHLYGVKVYITINTLIKESELIELDKFLKFLLELHVDGVIVQDLGAARMISKRYPALHLHASTQMTIHQWEGVRMLEEMGFQKVVLARELTLSEIKLIAEKTQLDIETFVHGALCVSYSGQCLMSSLIGGRSGNRGMCAQPCRLPFTLHGKTAYHLSPKDLATHTFLRSILDAGVTALKIEGRMKRPEYVAVLTDVYRKALDSLLSGESQDEAIVKASERALLQIFNRGGFTGGYYHEENTMDIMGPEKPNHWGIYLGKVTGSNKVEVEISLDEPLSSEDSILFWIAEGDIPRPAGDFQIKGSVAVMGYPGDTVTMQSRHRIPVGTLVYRTTQAAQMKAAEHAYTHPYDRKIRIMASAVFKVGERPNLTLSDAQGVTVHTQGSHPVQAAKNKPLTQEDIRSQLLKLGDTPYHMETLDILSDPSVFMPVSALNALRRGAAAALSEARIANFEKQSTLDSDGNATPPKLESVKHPHIEGGLPTLIGYIDDLSLSIETYQGLDILAYEPKDWPLNMDLLERQVEVFRQLGYGLRLVLPRLTRSADMALIKASPPRLWQMFDAYQIGNLGLLHMLREMDNINIYGDYSLNIFNTMALKQLKDLEILGTVLSVELTTGEIRDIIRKNVLPCEIIVFGRLPLMITEYCPHRKVGKPCGHCNHSVEADLTDRLGYHFPVVKRRVAHCYTEIQNSVPLLTAEDSVALLKTRAAAWGLKLTGYSKDTVSEVISIYRYALVHSREAFPSNLQDAIERFKKKGFTRGHFFRGVD